MKKRINLYALPIGYIFGMILQVIIIPFFTPDFINLRWFGGQLIGLTLTTIAWISIYFWSDINKYVLNGLYFICRVIFGAFVGLSFVCVYYVIPLPHDGVANIPTQSGLIGCGIGAIVVPLLFMFENKFKSRL